MNVLRSIFIAFSFLIVSATMPINLNNKATRCLWQLTKMAAGSATTSIGAFVFTKAPLIQTELKETCQELEDAKEKIKLAQEEIRKGQDTISTIKSYAAKKFETVNSYTPTLIKRLASVLWSHYTPGFVKRHYNDCIGQHLQEAVNTANSTVEKADQYANDLKQLPLDIDTKIKYINMINNSIGKARFPLSLSLMATGLSTVHASAIELKKELAELAIFKRFIEKNNQQSNPTAAA